MYTTSIHALTYLVDDVKRYVSNSRHRLVSSVSVGAHALSAFTAVNTFNSYITLAAASDRYGVLYCTTIPYLTLS